MEYWVLRCQCNLYSYLYEYILYNLNSWHKVPVYSHFLAYIRWYVYTGRLLIHFHSNSTPFIHSFVAKGFTRFPPPRIMRCEYLALPTPAATDTSDRQRPTRATDSDRQRPTKGPSLLAGHNERSTGTMCDDSHSDDDYSEEDRQKIDTARQLAYANRERRQKEAQQASELTALLFGGGGALADLVPITKSKALSCCANCRRAVDTPRVCSACRAACYCSDACLRTDLQHSRMCRMWRAQAGRSVAVQLPGSPAWISSCMLHAGCPDDRKAILTELELQSSVYAVACGCADGGTAAAVLYDDEPASFSVKACPSSDAPDGGAGGPARAAVVVPSRVVSHSARLSSWAEYYTARAISPTSPLALLMDLPLTIYYTLTSVVEPSVGRTRVHLLGAELREIVLAPLLRELALLMPSADLEVEMIGPGASSPSSCRRPISRSRWSAQVPCEHSAPLRRRRTALSPRSS